MSTKTKVRTIKRCIELCRKQLENVKAEVGAIKLEEEETDIEKLEHCSKRSATSRGHAKTFVSMPANVTSIEEVNV